MQNKDKDDGIEDSSLDMFLVILLEGASKEVVVVVTPSSHGPLLKSLELQKSLPPIVGRNKSSAHQSFNAHPRGRGWLLVNIVHTQLMPPCHGI